MIGVPARPTARTKKAPQDTAIGSRIRAEADLLASVTMPTANQRDRLEASAAAWNARAQLLQFVEQRFAARQPAHSSSDTAETNARNVRL
jgi:hypothetical protein